MRSEKTVAKLIIIGVCALGLAFMTVFLVQLLKESNRGRRH
jgi:hypothetical protein